MSKGVLAFRFDVDSVQCLRTGVPRLRKVADARGVRFTFFVTMGRSFHMASTLGRRWSRRARRRTGSQRPNPTKGTRSRSSGERAPNALPVARKLGWRGLLETVVLNPHLGRKYRHEIDALHHDGHELGLHGGSNHAVWQHMVHAPPPQPNPPTQPLRRASEPECASSVLLRPALDEFASRYGRPEGFASPGFQWNDHVLRLLDDEGFLYASDMTGEEPFRPQDARGSRHRHYQVPVNVAGRGRVPVIEEGLALGHDARRIAERAVAQIQDRRFALMYDHPYVAGVHHAVLDKIIEIVEGDYDIVTVAEYLARWRQEHG